MRSFIRHYIQPQERFMKSLIRALIVLSLAFAAHAQSTVFVNQMPTTCIPGIQYSYLNTVYGCAPGNILIPVSVSGPTNLSNPGPIGSTTPSTGNFTTITAQSVVTLTENPPALYNYGDSTSACDYGILYYYNCAPIASATLWDCQMRRFTTGRWTAPLPLTWRTIRCSTTRHPRPKQMSRCRL